MKIAFANQPRDFVAPPLPSCSLAIWITQVAQKLAELGQDVNVYACKLPGHEGPEKYGDVEYRRLPYKADRYGAAALKLLSRITSRPYFTYPSYYRRSVRALAADVTEWGADVVEIQGYSQFAPVIREVNSSAKIVLHMHSEWLTQLDPVPLRKAAPSIDMITFCSEYCAQKTREKFPELAERCKTVLNGVDIDLFKPAASKAKNGVKRLLFVGRVSPEKGVHVLLEAMRKVVERFPQTQLTIIGPDEVQPRSYNQDISDDPLVAGLEKYFQRPYRQMLDQIIDSSLSGKVRFLPGMGQGDLAAHYREADVFVFPSVWAEAFGMPLAEAGASGVPSVSTRRGGIPEVVEEGKTALLVPPADPDALAKAICELLGDEERRESMGMEGRRRAVQMFSWERIARSALDVYESIVNRPVHSTGVNFKERENMQCASY